MTPERKLLRKMVEASKHSYYADNPDLQEVADEVRALLAQPESGGGEAALSEEPTHDMLRALAGDPPILAASDEQELRARYKVMRMRAVENCSKEKT